MNNKDMIKAIGLVSAGVAAGSTCTYFGVRGRLKKKYEALADEEVASVKRSYALLRKEGPYSDPATAVAEYEHRVEDLQYASASATIEAQEALVEEKIQEAADEEKADIRNIFDERRTDMLIDAMQRQDVSKTEQLLSIREAEKQDLRDPDSYDDLASRDPSAPFHIPKDDYFNYENEFEKLSLTYYEGDATLVDDQDKIIRDVEAVIGLQSLNRFGQASDDPNIVFVRNERLRADFEVTRDDREYTEVVLGIKSDPEDNARRIRRMRDDE